MEKESVLLPGMAEPEPSEKSPLTTQAFNVRVGQPAAKPTQLRGKCVLFTSKAQAGRQTSLLNVFATDDELPGTGACGAFLALLSYLLILLFFPFSLMFTVKVS